MPPAIFNDIPFNNEYLTQLIVPCAIIFSLLINSLEMGNPIGLDSFFVNDKFSNLFKYSKECVVRIFSFEIILGEKKFSLLHIPFSISFFGIKSYFSIGNL